MNNKIIDYVELLFDDVPYSKESFMAKEKIVDGLLKMHDGGCTIKDIIEEYNSLFKLAEVAGYNRSDVEKWLTKKNLIMKNELYNMFKKERKFSYLISILSVLILVYFYNIIVNFHLIYILLAIVFSIICFKVFIGHNKKNTKKEKYSLDSYIYLQQLHDKYSKKLINIIWGGSALISILVLMIMQLVINLKSSEIIEVINVNILYVEIIVILVLKNYLLTKWLDGRLTDNRVKKLRDQLLKVILFSVLFWIISIIISINISKNVFNIFFWSLIIYSIVYFIYIIYYRKSVVYKNMVINRKRVVFVSIFAIVVGMYGFMRREVWLVQPYINSVPNIGASDNKIEYNDETGVYTITTSKEDFKVLQLTDIHLGGSVFSYYKDIKALQAVYKLINHTRPDFVVVTGDLTFPMGIMSLSFDNYTPVMQFASFMRNLGVPWAFTYGNHDTEAIATTSKEGLMSLYKSLSYKTSKNLLYPYKQPNITGRNNQLIEIKNADGTLNQAIFLIDSNAYTNEGINKYDFIHDDQVEWYKKEVNRLSSREGKTISSLVFFHIPLNQYEIAYNLYEKGSKEVTYYFGSNDEKMIDKVCDSEYPSKLFDTALELGSTKGFFCGHDHYNNMSLEYKGIRLTYGMSIDYLAMPGIENDTKQRGATLITLHSDSSVDIEQVPLIKIK